jgi:hypothetical protein
MAEATKVKTCDDGCDHEEHEMKVKVKVKVKVMMMNQLKMN